MGNPDDGTPCTYTHLGACVHRARSRLMIRLSYMRGDAPGKAAGFSGS